MDLCCAIQVFRTPWDFRSEINVLALHGRVPVLQPKVYVDSRRSLQEEETRHTCFLLSVSTGIPLVKSWGSRRDLSKFACSLLLPNPLIYHSPNAMQCTKPIYDSCRTSPSSIQNLPTGTSSAHHPSSSCTQDTHQPP